MKRFLVILAISLFSISLFSKSSQYENDLVVIKSVVSTEHFNGTHSQIVRVELTASGRNYMQAYGYNEVSVAVSPKNHIWDFLIDTRSSKYVYLSINKPGATVIFKCTKQCRNDDFKIEELNWRH